MCPFQDMASECFSWLLVILWIVKSWLFSLFAKTKNKQQQKQTLHNILIINFIYNFQLLNIFKSIYPFLILSVLLLHIRSILNFLKWHFVIPSLFN